MLSNIPSIAGGYRSGFGTASFFTTSKDKPSETFLADCIKRSWVIAKTTYKLNAFSASVVKPGVFKTQLVIGAITLSIMNLGSAISMSERGSDSKIAAAVWRATPVLVTITNIALLAFEYQSNPVKVTAAVAAIALTFVAPDLAGYIAMPAKVVTFVCADNLTRVVMVVETVASFLASNNT